MLFGNDEANAARHNDDLLADSEKLILFYILLILDQSMIADDSVKLNHDKSHLTPRQKPVHF